MLDGFSDRTMGEVAQAVLEVAREQAATKPRLDLEPRSFQK